MAKTPKPVKVKKEKKSSGGEQEGFLIAEGLDGIRLNPGMYMGEPGADMAYRAVKEPADNVYDEMMAGRCKVLEVIIDYDNDLNIVADKAGGIPTDFKKLRDGSKETIMTAAFSRVHAGGKFNDKAYKTSAGTHGVGVAALNAISTKLRVWSMYKGGCAHQMWEKGEASSGKDPKKVKTIDKDVMSLLSEKKHSAYGTVVAWTLDQSIVSADASRSKKLPKNYRHASPDPKRIGNWLRNMALLNPGFEIRLSLIKNGKRKDFNFHNTKDLAHVVKTMCDERELKSVGKPFILKTDYITCALTWTDHVDQDNFLSFVNASPTIDGGWHVVGFRDALFDAIKPHMKESKGKKKKQGFKQEDLLIGLTGMFDWRMHGASYTSQVKDKLASRVEKEVYETVAAELLKYFKENKKVAATIIKRAEAMNKGREELSAVVKSMADTKKKLKGNSLPADLITASGCKPHERELVVVEGDSAGGCFIGTTPVLLSNGIVLTFEELARRTKYGDVFEGVSFNIDTQKFESHIFDEPRLTKYTDTLVDVVIRRSGSSEERVYRCTLDHPWLINGITYLPASELSQNDILTQRGVYGGFEATSWVHEVRTVKLAEPVPVYDATMPVHHNFCLGCGLVVHNTAKHARDPYHQEVMLAGGKPLNGLKASLAEVLKHKEVQGMLVSIGADLKTLDPKAENPVLKTDKLRIGNLLFLMDADPDGFHIATLFLGVIYRLLPDLMREGRVWIIDSTLYNVIHNGINYGGMTFEECRAKAPAAVKDKDIVRAKGWGEVEPATLEAIAFNPKSRRLIRINPFESVEQERFFRGVLAEDAVHRRRLLGLEDA